ncbi:TPA: hypothetical protein DEF17_08365 [bacterium]|nr:MAG: hypothetical protein AUJ18_09920 [Candidatus Hydrogenedentes bacterium CG1_02_42_14]HBW47922.1 hypothetical protein [bacterium]
MASKNMRVSWLIGGVVGLFFLLGLFWDVWQSYSARVSLERDVKIAAEAGAKFLPYKLKDARDAALTVLKSRGLTPKPEYISLSPDGKSMKVSVISEVTAYVAWIFGSRSMKFEASSTAEVSIKGGGPVDQLNLKDVSFALKAYSDFKPGQNVIIWSSGDSDVPSYAIKAWKITEPSILKVNDKSSLSPMDSLMSFKEEKVYYVAMLEDIEGNRAKIKGFAAFKSTGLNAQARLTGQFIRTHIENKPKNMLPEINDFGLVGGGAAEIKIH